MRSVQLLMLALLATAANADTLCHRYFGANVPFSTFQAALPCSNGSYEVTGLGVTGVQLRAASSIFTDNDGYTLLMLRENLVPAINALDVNLTGVLLNPGIWVVAVGGGPQASEHSVYCSGGVFDDSVCTGSLSTFLESSPNVEYALAVPGQFEIQAQFDNIRVDSSIGIGFDVPEPSSGFLLGGLLVVISCFSSVKTRVCESRPTVRRPKLRRAAPRNSTAHPSAAVVSGTGGWAHAVQCLRDDVL
jgi:hypothetical protein